VALRNGMILTELEKPITLAAVGEILKNYFDYTLPTSGLSKRTAHAIFEELNTKIAEFRNSESYYTGERNQAYLSMLTASRFLAEYLNEHMLMEKDLPTNPAAYHKGAATAIQHGISTGANFVPHVAGSAVGAFIGGVKGRALH